MKINYRNNGMGFIGLDFWKKQAIFALDFWKIIV